MSEAVSPERPLKLVRAHWAVENGLHRVPAVTMNEDGQRNRTGNGARNLAMIRRMASDLTRLAEGRKGMSMRGRMKMAGWNHEVLLETIRAAADLDNGARAKKFQKR